MLYTMPEIHTFFDALFQNQQYDAHVSRYNGQKWLKNKSAEYDARYENVKQETAEIIAQIKASRA